MTNVGSGILTALTAISPFGIGFVSHLSGTPWGVTVVVTLGALLVAFVCAVMPQESSDRLAWWQSYWARGGPTDTRKRAESGTATPGATADKLSAREPPDAGGAPPPGGT